jgi:hypothetical protein
MDGTEISGYDDDGNWVNTAATEQKLVEGDNHYSIDTIGDYKPSDLTVTVTSIKVDGEEVDFDASKILCGNIEDNNNRYRIEIYNAYGKTANDPTIDPMTFAFTDSLEVTFTIEGLGEVKTFPEVEAYSSSAASDAVDSVDEAVADDSATEEDAAAEEDTEAAE